MSRFAGRTVMVLAMVTSLALVVPVSAGAKTPHSTMTIQQYRAALRAYEQAKNAIDLTLHESIATAKAKEIAEMMAAKTEAQKYLARVEFNEVRATDVAKWQTQLTNLGAPPQPPHRPALKGTRSLMAARVDSMDGLV